MTVKDPKLYEELFEWWPLLSRPEDYAEEAHDYHQALTEGIANVNTVLELGCGGGNNASYLKDHFELTLVDLSEGMLSVSRRLNPECEHIQGDMRGLRLEREFDAVFIHDAVMYMRDIDDLHKAIETAFVHCKPGGVALFVPDFIRETFEPKTDHGGYDGDTKSLRYLEWIYDPDSRDATYTVDYAILVHHEDGAVETHQDRHELGLFSETEWGYLMEGVGFTHEMVHFSFTGEQVVGFLGRKPD